MADEITSEDIVDAALAPASVSVDGNTVNARPVAELTEAQNRTASESAVSSRTNRGIRFNKIVPPGGGT